MKLILGTIFLMLNLFLIDSFAGETRYTTLDANGKAVEIKKKDASKSKKKTNYSKYSEQRKLDKARKKFLKRLKIKRSLERRRNRK